jgi:hypothetical protein
MVFAFASDVAGIPSASECIAPSLRITCKDAKVAIGSYRGGTISKDITSKTMA